MSFAADRYSVSLVAVESEVGVLAVIVEAAVIAVVVVHHRIHVVAGLADGVPLLVWRRLRLWRRTRVLRAGALTHGLAEVLVHRVETDRDRLQHERVGALDMEGPRMSTAIQVLEPERLTTSKQPVVEQVDAIAGALRRDLLRIGLVNQLW